ncbi:uncharacterized protein DUF5081 [Breznakia blatticola]|uniref:Uncharacterized protein DUF5081 n=1 Tax=Breznakia blatticola TaxID=1754012 RepID=A0A4R7ZG09_9FIRM|nr:DUF5081 family protein [Breznakia blatticola]TDW16242.1 uncharacterized protein DUF5081 [Breznakia blatticola]
MIALNTNEILALNGLLDSEAIHGIKLPTVPQEQEEAVTKEVIESLTEKEFFIDGKMSDKLFAITQLLEEYKTSERYVFINQMRIGLKDEDEVTFLEINEDETIYLGRIQRVNIVKQIVGNSEFLKKEQKTRYFGNEEKDCSFDEYTEYVNSKNDEWKDMIVIQVYQEEQLQNFYTYYMSDNEGYCYNHLRKTSKEKGPKDIRQDLIDILEVVGDRNE